MAWVWVWVWAPAPSWNRTWARRLPAALLACAVFGLPTAALADTRDDEPAITAVALRAGERIVLDGRLGHPAWQRAPVFSGFVERFPDTGAVPRQATELRVLFDAQALYFGVRAFDSAPERIRAPLVRHDGVNRTQDFVAVYIDAIGNRQSAQFFRVNAAGSTADGMHTAADDNEDFAPDFDFDAAAHRDAQGWTAVLRIPFASLRFAGNTGGPGAAPWRMLVLRRTPREQFAADTSVLVPRDAPSQIATLQPLLGVVLPEHAQFLSLRPSLTLRTQRTQSGDAPALREHHAEASLDLKWRPRPELVVDATLNPDFSQVALDVPQLAGNTRYALSLAEKRPFFFESSDLLRSPTDALYTRSFTAPSGGLRATWRGPGLAGTVLAIADRGGASVLLPGAYGTGYADQPGSRGVAARVLADRPGLQWGGLLALRRYDDGRGDNQVAGPDLAWQISEGWRLRAQWLHASTSAQPGPDGQLAQAPRVGGHRGVLKANYQAVHVEADASLDDSSAGFRHDSGFVNQTGVRSAYGRIAWGWQSLAPFNDFWFNLEGQATGEPASGRLVARDVFPSLWFTGPHNLEGWLHWHGHSALRTAAGQPLLAEHFWKAGLTVTPAPWVPMLTAKLQWGHLGDVLANRVRPGAIANLTVSTRPLPWLELEPSLWRAWLGEGGRRLYDESASQVLAVAHIDARQSLRAIVQRTRYGREAEPAFGVAFDRQGATNSSLTYAWRRTAGSVLYVGASRERQGVPGSLLVPTRGSEVFVKLQLDVDDWRAWLRPAGTAP